MWKDTTMGSARNPPRHWSFRVAVAAFAAMIGLANSPAQAALGCRDVALRLHALDLEYHEKFVCDPKPASIPHIQTPDGTNQISDHNGEPPCMKGTPASRVAWQHDHQAELDALNAQKAVCIKLACPSAINPALVAATHGVLGHAPATPVADPDMDRDGIPDATENALIARFSPYLRFSDGQVGGSDLYPPTDPLYYLQRSAVDGGDHSTPVLTAQQLANDSHAVLGLSPASNVLRGYGADYYLERCVNEAPRTDYYVTPPFDSLPIVPHVPAQTWADAMQIHHLGMFAHVSPFIPTGPNDLPCHCPKIIVGTQHDHVIPPSAYETDSNNAHYYKIEYYQFFPFNHDDQVSKIGDHESDWSIITLVYDTATDKIVAVSHWAHGVEMRFDIRNYPDCTRKVDPVVGNECIFTGPMHSRSNVSLAKLGVFTIDQDHPEYAQNNEVRFAQDASGEFSHPVVYVEHDSHEFWPTEHWSFFGAPAHPGNDTAHSYLATDIPNLGEIQHPMGDEAAVLLLYSGSWGNWNSSNSPPPGPALHKPWNWFMTNNRVPISCRAAE